MSILDIFKGMSGREIEELFNALDAAIDDHFSEHGDRRRFIEACRKLSYADIAIVQQALDASQEKLDYEAMAGQIEQPLRAADAVLMLEEELHRTRHAGVFLFLKALISRMMVAKGLKRSRFVGWEYYILENKHIPAEFIDFLWQINKDETYRLDAAYEIPRLIARLPNCPLNVLRDLAHWDDEVVRKAVARHRNSDEELTDVFLNSTRLSERREVARSRYASKEALLSLMRDKYDRVSDVARRQFAKRFPDDTITEEAVDAAVAKRIEKPYIKPENPVRAFDAHFDRNMGIEHIKSLKPSQRASVARIADKEIVVDLVKDSSKVVRRGVAANYYCPDETLRGYLHDADTIVVNNAFKNLARRYPDITIEDSMPTHTLDVSYKLLNLYVRERPTLDVYWEKLSSATEAEVERCKIVAQYSNNPMIQKRIVQDLSEIPPHSLHWHLLSGLADNRQLSDSVARKIVLELGFGTEKIVCRSRDRDLVSEYLQKDDIPAGVRSRILAHLESLRSTDQ